MYQCIHFNVLPHQFSSEWVKVAFIISLLVSPSEASLQYQHLWMQVPGAISSISPWWWNITCLWPGETFIHHLHQRGGPTVPLSLQIRVLHCEEISFYVLQTPGFGFAEDAFWWLKRAFASILLSPDPEDWWHLLKEARHPVPIYTDHKNLLILQTAQHLNLHLACWPFFFSHLNFLLYFRLAVKNVKAGALSCSSVPADYRCASPFTPNKTRGSLHKKEAPLPQYRILSTQHSHSHLSSSLTSTCQVHAERHRQCNDDIASPASQRRLQAALQGA